MNTSADDVTDVPFVVVTVTGTEPAACGGEVAVIDVVLFTVTLAAGVEPNMTAAVVVKCVPVIVTDVAPDEGPVGGLIAVTFGAVRVETEGLVPVLGGSWSVKEPVPPGLVPVPTPVTVTVTPVTVPECL